MPIQKITPGVVDTSVFSAPTISSPIVSGNLSLDSTGTTGVRSPAANTLTFHTAGTEDIRITSDGNVGIGVTTPTHKLAIGYSNADSSNKIAIGNIGSYQGLLDYNNGNEIFTIENTTDYSIGGINFKVNGADRGFFDINGNFRFNSGYGSVATAYGCRAWVNFNGTGTPAIRSSGNVSSLTDNGTGDYTINFATGLVDNNYACVFSGMRDSDGNGSLNTTALKSGSYGNTVSTGSVRVLSENDSGTRVDVQMYTAAFFR